MDTGGALGGLLVLGGLTLGVLAGLGHYARAHGMTKGHDDERSDLFDDDIHEC